MWKVKLLKQPPGTTYKDFYFPRTFKYKKDAEQLKAQIVSKGGLATIENTHPKTSKM